MNSTDLPMEDTCKCPKLYLVPLNSQEVAESSKASTEPSVPPIVWVLGGPGSGKGVQCEKIINKYGFTHLSTGELLRAEVQGGSERAQFITSVMEHGELVPGKVALELLKNAIQVKAVDSPGFLVDGYPRGRSQGIAFEQTIAPPVAVLFFEASGETLAERLRSRAAHSGRPDDNEETIKIRLKHYEETRQKLDRYPWKIYRINAEPPVDDVFAEVEKVLDPLVKGN